MVLHKRIYPNDQLIHEKFQLHKLLGKWNLKSQRDITIYLEKHRKFAKMLSNC